MDQLLRTDVALWVVLVAAAPGLVGLVVALVALGRVRAARRDHQVLMPDGTNSGSLVAGQAAMRRALERLHDGLDAARGETTRVSNRADEALRTAVRYQGLVRFDAYGDVSGNQSWSLALLDADRTGTIITQLNGRQDTRTYAIGLRAGVPDRELSDEERAAVTNAMATPGGAA